MRPATAAAHGIIVRMAAADALAGAPVAAVVAVGAAAAAGVAGMAAAVTAQGHRRADGLFRIYAPSGFGSRQTRSNGSRHMCGATSWWIAFGPHEPVV